MANAVKIVITEHIELIIRGVVTQSFVFAQNVNTEGHGLGARLIAAGQTLTIETVAICAASRYFGVYTGFRAIIVLIRA